LKVTIDQPTDDRSDACLICKKPLIDNQTENKGKEINIQNRIVWVCKECLAPFERGRRIGQIELNSKVIQFVSSIDSDETGWRLKEKILDLLPNNKKSSFIKKHLHENSIPNPREIYSAIDKTVVGQNQPKKIISVAVHEHYTQAGELDSYSIPNSHHILMIGPSGSGKTLLANTIASKLNVPFVSSDSTIFSPTGFQGADVDSMIMEIVQKSKGISELAEKGIVFVDELDKLASYHHEGKSEVMNKSTQSSLLRLVEGRQVRLSKEHSESIVVHTGKMLFLFGGAFIGLSDIVAKKMGYKGKRIGFRSNEDNESEYEKAMRTHEILSQASYDVLLDSIEEYGILTELLGRIPSIVALAPLSKEELRKILLDTDHSPIKLQQKLFADNGYQLVFTEAFVDECIDKAFKMSTGARALKSIVRLAVSEAAFDLLGEPTDEEFEDDDLEIINFKGAVVIDSSSLINPCAYVLKDKLIEDKNIEMSISI
jgi:endopeptidase Clp ATP-binding regulatory subunit ClpX